MQQQDMFCNVNNMYSKPTGKVVALLKFCLDGESLSFSKNVIIIHVQSPC